MININNYILEKLHISKDTKYEKIVPVPTTIDEFIDLVETYLGEWWKEYFKLRPEDEISSEAFKSKYDSLITQAKSDKVPLADLLENLPNNFIKYMNKKYKFNYGEY